MRFTAIEAPGKVKLPPRSISSTICFLLGSLECKLERFADQLFAFFPECLGVLRIERIRTHPFAGDGDFSIVRHNGSDVTVLAIATANLVSGRNDSSPHRSCRSLRNGLPLEGPLARLRLLLIDAVN